MDTKNGLLFQLLYISRASIDFTNVAQEIPEALHSARQCLTLLVYYAKVLERDQQVFSGKFSRHSCSPGCD